MSLPQTEKFADPNDCIDVLAPDAALSAMLHGQIGAVACVADVLAEIESGARLIVDTIRADGTLVYVAAGSSGLMALADCSELPGTFGIAQHQVRIEMAGGVPVNAHMPGGSEDDRRAAQSITDSLKEADLIIALSASGSTPYSCEITRCAKQKGLKVIGLANNPDTRLLQDADVAIYLATPPEVLAGSTRMAAGTAQKVALNLMSTLAGVLLGHVHDGMMVNLKADNEKLHQRAARIVSQILNISGKDAKAALDAANGDTKRAVLMARGMSPERAGALLLAHGQNLRNCLSEVHSSQAQ